MTRYEFIKIVDDYKKVRNGNGREIADKVGVSYVTYQNYCKGMAPKEDIRIAIAKEIKAIAMEVGVKS